MNIKACLQLMRFDKPVGTLLLLWPCWWALAVAHRLYVPISHCIIFTLGVVVMRAAGCIANDLADQAFDGFVERTKTRPLITGAVTATQAKQLLAVLLLVALLLVMQLNVQTQLLSCVGAALALCYPYMKRWIRGPQLFLGLAFSWSIPMVYTAANAPLDLGFWVLCLTSLLWPVIYDTFYALTDKEDDLKIGVNSTAIWFGQYDKKILTGLQLILAILLCVLAPLCQLSTRYYLGLIPVFMIMSVQLYWVYQQDRLKAFNAFQISQVQGGFIFLAICLGYYFYE